MQPQSGPTVKTDCMKKLFTLLLLFPLFSQADAQNSASISGKILDDEGSALSYANVLLLSAADSSKLVKAGYTDESGEYKLAPLPAGEYRMRVTYLGMPAFQSDPFQLKDGEDLVRETVKMTAGSAEVDEVQIRAEKPVLTIKPDMTVFNVDGTPNAIGNNALELLRKSPGVVVDNNENIMLLGKSGVLIYIDGKRTPLSAEDLAGLLKSMQSSEIESIEIITNPGAKYDAEGNAGIINIKMKRDKSLGANATVNLGYAIGRFSKYNGSVSANYRNKNVNVFGSYSGNTGVRWNFMDGYRIQNGTVFTMENDMYHDNTANNIRLGMDYSLGKKHIIGGLFSGFLFSQDGDTENRTVIADQATDAIQNILVSNTSNKATRNNLNGNLNYRFDGGNGTTFNVDADYGRFTNNTETFQPNQYFDSTETNVLFENNYTTYAPSTIDIASFKADYERELWGGKFGAGFKLSYVKTDNVFNFYELQGETEVLDTNRSNQFVYTENVNAAYVNYLKQIKKFAVQAGLRLEQTHSLGELYTISAGEAQDPVDRQYVNLFPSAGVTYNLSRINSFRLNYSRRIDRPRYEDLNPFEFQLNELSYRKGNPFLRPQLTHNIQLSHTYKYTLNTTVGYSRTSDFFTNLTDTIRTNASFMTTENLGTRDVFSANISYPFTIKKIWSIFTNLGVTHVKNQADFGEGKIIDIAATSFNIYHQQTLKLPEEFSLQLSGFYSSPGIWGANFETNDFWGVEAGLQKGFLQGRGNLKLAVSDIFLGMRWRGYQEFGALQMDINGGWESRQFRVNLTYLFGNDKVKSARKRKTGLEDESGRANGGGGGTGPGQ